MLGILRGLAGSGPNGSFFELPGWVDASKPPGATQQTPTAWSVWAGSILRLKHLLYSPNLIWFAISVAVYVLFPYDLEAAARGFSRSWVGPRLCVNLGVAAAYYGFFDLALYGALVCGRKFNPTSWPGADRLRHNAGYAVLGVAQYTLWEVGMMRLWATGQVAFWTDADVLSSPRTALLWLAATAMVPVWRGLHFYFSHRLIHIRPLYKFVHCLHHRNVDIEPLAGLTMHPVEHMYYFSCVAPSLWLRLHPFHFLFNGQHLLLSPAASHSGWEDHVQSDQFHYVHHAVFEANYGSASFPLDHLFGTFRDTYKTGKADKTGKAGGGSAAAGAAAAAKGDTKAAYDGSTARVAPLVIKSPRFFSSYLHASKVLIVMVASRVYTYHSGGQLSEAESRAWAFATAFGPIVTAVALTYLSGDRLAMRWPFHKESLAGIFGPHVLVGMGVAVVPVYQLVRALLSEGVLVAA